MVGEDVEDAARLLAVGPDDGVGQRGRDDREAAMKAKRARDKARDEAEKQKDAIASGEQTDWKEAMKEWNEYYEK